MSITRRAITTTVLATILVIASAAVLASAAPKNLSAERLACQRFDTATATYNTDGFIGDLNSAAAVAPASMARGFGEWRHGWYTVSWTGLSDAVHTINASCTNVRGPRQINR